MTGKRFTVEKFTELEYGIKQDDETLIGLSLDKITAKYIVEQWNKLADENEQLRHDATILIQSNQDYRRENEELKENCKNYNWYKEYKRLLNENEQLKQENEKLESLWEDKCIREYMGIVGEYALQEMHDKKYGDK